MKKEREEDVEGRGICRCDFSAFLGMQVKLVEVANASLLQSHEEGAVAR